MHQQLKCFVQDGPVYRWKGQKGFYYALALFLLLIAIACWVYGTNKGVRYLGVFVALLGLAGVLRSTASIGIDTANRRIISRNFFFSPEKIYDYNDFDYFRIVKSSYLFFTINVSAFMIFNQNGKERSILLQQGMFTTRPLQRLTDEMSAIMGIAEQEAI